MIDDAGFPARPRSAVCACAAGAAASKSRKEPKSTRHKPVMSPIPKDPDTEAIWSPIGGAEVSPALPKPCERCGTRAKQLRCGTTRKRPHSPKWKPWRMRCSSACRRLSCPMRRRDHARRRFSDRRSSRRDAGARRIRPARPFPGHRPAAAEPRRHRPPAQHDLALPPADSTTGPSTRRRWATSSATS